MDTKFDITELARAIAFRITPESLLTVSDLAAMFKVGERHVRDRIMRLPDFPKPIRLPTLTGTQGHPRWRLADVQAFLSKYTPEERPQRRGAPRKGSYKIY
jgi:hypothetical protein